MSHACYNEMWREAQGELRALMARDTRLAARQRETDKRAALTWMLRHYADYIRITRKLDECYDQLVQPQKRLLVRRLLDGCIGRLLELKHELVNELDKSNFHYFDDILIERRLTYEDLEVPSPRYYYRENEIQLQQRRELIDRILEKVKNEPKKVPTVVVEIPEDEVPPAAEPRGSKDQASEPLPLPAPTPSPSTASSPSPSGAPAAAGTVTSQSLVAAPTAVPVSLSAPIPEPVPEPVPEPPTKRRRRVDLEELQAQYAKKDEEPPEVRALKEAVHLIQIHERARQCRLLANNRRHVMLKKYQEPKKRQDPERLEWAALTLQKYFRGRKVRQHIKKCRQKEDELIGAITPKFINYSYRDRIREVQALRRSLRRDLQVAYDQAIVTEQEYVDRVLSPQIYEDIGDELREWMRAWYYDVKKLPKFPPEKERKLKGQLLGLPKGAPKDFFPEVDCELPGIPPRKLGGSNLITAEFWCASTEFKLVQEKLAKSKGKKTQKKKLSAEEKKELRKKRREEKKAAKEKKRLEKLRGFQLEESAGAPALTVAEREYTQEWEFKRPDDENPGEQPYKDLIRVDEVHDKQTEVRLAVDELMRTELELLKDAEWREKQKRKKKKRRRRKRRGKKKRKKGKKGRRKKKDPLGDRTPEDLLEELVRAGVVQNSRVAYMDEFYGEPSYSNYELRQRFQDPLPALGDIRQAVREYCILPLGSARAHELAPLTKSVLLAGPPQCGKSLLADIVCTETGALRLDLTPEALAAAYELYPDKKAKKKFLLVLNKVARIMQPTVVVMEDAHRNYYRKIPKEERPLKPKKYAKMLKKFAKGIKKKDQILILGTSAKPWLARGRKLLKAYQRHIFVPPLDYGSRSLMWYKLIMAYHGVDRFFEVTPLAHVTAWVSIPTMREVVNRALSVERRVQLDYRPLQHQELLELLLKYPPNPTLKDRRKWEKWWKKTPMQRKRAKMLAEYIQKYSKQAPKRK